MGAGLQIGEVEAVVPGIPGLVLGELHLNSSAVFWLCCSAGAAGFSLLDAQCTVNKCTVSRVVWLD